MNRFHIKWAIVTVMGTVVLTAVGLIAKPEMAPKVSSQSSPEEGLIDRRRLAIYLQHNVPDNRVNEIVSLMQGTIDFTDPVLHMVVVKFSAPLEVNEVNERVREVEQFPEVRYATPD